MQFRRIARMLSAAMTAAVLLSCDSSVDPSLTDYFGLPSDSVFYGSAAGASLATTASGTARAKSDFAWSSSDTSIAVVDDTGAVLGVGIGRAKITASLDGKHDTFEVRVVLQRVDNGVSFVDGTHSYVGQCALTAAGAVYCRHVDGQDDPDVYQPLPGATGLTFTSIYTALDSQCGLVTSGQIYCWGRNGHFVFASNVPSRADNAPVAVKTDLRFKAMMTSGHSSVCGVNTADDVLYCWGHNDLHQLGREPTMGSDSSVAPVGGALRARSVAGANHSACAIDIDGHAQCWGSLNEATAGVGSGAGPVVTPQAVVGSMVFASIENGDAHRCALTQAGDAYCWGNNSNGDLGIGNTNAAPVGPQAVAGNLKFKSLWISVDTQNRESTCGVTLADDLYCWGYFYPASIRTRIGAAAYAPFQIARGVKFRAMSTRFGEMCAITKDGKAVCW